MDFPDQTGPNHSESDQTRLERKTGSGWTEPAETGLEAAGADWNNKRTDQKMITLCYTLRYRGNRQTGRQRGPVGCGQAGPGSISSPPPRRDRGRVY